MLGVFVNQRGVSGVNVWKGLGVKCSQKVDFLDVTEKVLIEESKYFLNQ